MDIHVGNNVFQHTAARRRLLFRQSQYAPEVRFQHTAARRRLELSRMLGGRAGVSTHSRPKAAAYFESVKAQNTCFNTQPPEGGCLVTSFNGVPCAVSTHSRPKAAVFPCRAKCDRRPVSTHSRPKAAVLRQCSCYYLDKVSTHSRPKAAEITANTLNANRLFQHTAARRRLSGVKFKSIVS